MGKRKRVKKNVDDNPNGEGKPSTSCSSCYWTRSRKEAQDPEIKELELIIKRKKETNDSSNSPVQEQTDDEAAGEGPINDLPPEMLTEILKYVEDWRLFDCRLVSRQWLGISTGILATTTDIMLRFQDYEMNRDVYRYYSWKLDKKKSNRLRKFVESMEESKHCPFASFFFNVEGPSFFDGKDWKGFLSLFAPPKPNPNLNQIQNQRTKIKCLYLKCDRLDDTKIALLFMEKLSDLLLNKIPRLEELSLDFRSYENDLENVKFFPPQENPESESATKTKRAAVSASVPVPVQLPYLKVLVIKSDMFENFPGIMEDLLIAAVNLTKIHVEPPSWIQEVFQFLHSFGKLHLLKKVEIDLDQEFLSEVQTLTHHQRSDFLLAFKLRELKLKAFDDDINPAFYADATSFISTLLESSKDTLAKLQLPPLGFLNGLQFPKFTKLRTLELKTWGIYDDDNDEDAKRRQQLFPPGSRSRDVFPAVSDLSLISEDWQRAFPQEDAIPIFPSVDNFCFNDYELVEENVIAKLGFMCPNLKHCTIQKVEKRPDYFNSTQENPEQFNFSQVGRDIWTHLKQLESLEVDVDVNFENHAFPALDSCFTGISIENCQRLQNLMKAEKTRNKKKSRVKLPESEELRALTKREHPSILDMKNLKKLIVNPCSVKTRLQGKNFFTTKITWISQEFAFKLMPQLEFKGTSPSASS